MNWIFSTLLVMYNIQNNYTYFCLLYDIIYLKLSIILYAAQNIEQQTNKPTNQPTVWLQFDSLNHCLAWV